MPLRNRVDPWGELHATPERGTMMGNRGGKFHREDKTLGKRRWASRHWLRGRLLTPPSIAAILAKGYEPRWHESALRGDGT